MKEEVLNKNNEKEKSEKKANFLKDTIEHIDITKIDSTEIIESMKKMSFSARDMADAAELMKEMTADEKCIRILTLSGSTGAAGCLSVYADMIRYNMVDVIVSTGASVIDMDFFEALGFKHYKGDWMVDDREMRDLRIDRIYDTFIDEEELQTCDMTVAEIAETLEDRPYSSREFIREIGRWLNKNPDRAKKQNSLIQLAFEYDIPIFVPAFSDCSAGLGLIKYQEDRIKAGRPYLTIDSVADFRELTYIKMEAEARGQSTGIFMVGGGVPKNFTQDMVIGAEILGGKEYDPHKYAVQVTVADVRDGALSSSELREATSWGKVTYSKQKMVFAEAASVIPQIMSYVFHSGLWKNRNRMYLSDQFGK
jgi:deoxyhypusine synthase